MTCRYPKVNKCAVLTLLIFCAVISCDAAAAPSGGSRVLPKGRVELGYEYNAMFDRTVDRSWGDISTYNNFYTLSYGAFDWLSLDGKIGIGYVTHEGSNGLPKIEYNTGFAGGYGFRIKAYDNKKYGARLIISAQHISVHPQDRSVDNDKYESFLDDWQAGAIVAKDIKFLTLYAGMKGSDCEIVYKTNGHDKKRRSSKDHIGLIAGVEAYLFDNRARVGAEGRFFDETAISVSVSCMF